MSSDSPIDSFCLPLSIVQVRGSDAVRVVNNLATSDLARLEVGECTETFLTEVRGRTLGHVTAWRTESSLLLFGAKGQSESIAAHVDKYTIREDATASIQDDQFVATIFPPSSGESHDGAAITDWLGKHTLVRLEGAQSDGVQSDAAAGSNSKHAGDGFHDARIFAGFPWWGLDFDSTNLPQEVNRDSIAISFTKGCYLGQETVARLDALGQVQKKLVRLSIRSGTCAAGEKIMADEKSQARITSVTSDGTVAFAMVRRAWFDPGRELHGKIDDREVSAVVLG